MSSQNHDFTITSDDQHSSFYEIIGRLITTFANVEFDLARLLAYLEYGKRCNPFDHMEIFGFGFDDKIGKINKHLRDKPIYFNSWMYTKPKLKDCNNFRRFLAHGVVSLFPHPDLQCIVKSKQKNGKKGFIIRDISYNEVENNLKILRESFTSINKIIRDLDDELSS